MGNYTIFEGLENPRGGRQARNLTTNVPKILDLKSSSEQICFKNCRWPLTYLDFQSFESFSTQKHPLSLLSQNSFTFLLLIFTDSHFFFKLNEQWLWTTRSLQWLRTECQTYQNGEHEMFSPAGEGMSITSNYLVFVAYCRSQP